MIVSCSSFWPLLSILLLCFQNSLRFILLALLSLFIVWVVFSFSSSSMHSLRFFWAFMYSCNAVGVWLLPIFCASCRIFRFSFLVCLSSLAFFDSFLLLFPILIFLIPTVSLMVCVPFYYPRLVLTSGYCRCLRLSVSPPVRPSPSLSAR